MDGNTGKLDPGKASAAAVYLTRERQFDAEFVLRLASGNLLMGLGVDIWVDAERSSDFNAERGRHF